MSYIAFVTSYGVSLPGPLLGAEVRIGTGANQKMGSLKPAHLQGDLRKCDSLREEAQSPLSASRSSNEAGDRGIGPAFALILAQNIGRLFS